jgi:hypothetical protein
VDDLRKLARVHAYIKKTTDLVLRFASGCEVELIALIDASFGVHHDFTSRSGLVLRLAVGAVGGSSSKQKLVVKDSTESEIVNLSNESTKVIWAREWLLIQE